LFIISGSKKHQLFLHGQIETEAGNAGEQPARDTFG
jgi:hypothetical protein